MGGNAFDVLLRHFDARMECFASPFNCRYSKYCSAFQDTDVPFGRCSFFVNYFFPFESAKSQEYVHRAARRSLVANTCGLEDNKL